MITVCPNCGHAEYVHYMFVGRCCHGELEPKDGLTCDCKGVSKK